MRAWRRGWRIDVVCMQTTRRESDCAAIACAQWRSGGSGVLKIDSLPGPLSWLKYEMSKGHGQGYSAWLVGFLDSEERVLEDDELTFRKLAEGDLIEVATNFGDGENESVALPVEEFREAVSAIMQAVHKDERDRRFADKKERSKKGVRRK